MKRIVLCFIFSVSGLLVQAQLLLSENFDYPIGSDIYSHGWTIHSGASHNDSITVTNGLVYDGYPGSGIGGAALLDSVYADQHKKFEAQTSGNVYIAFLVNVTKATINGDYFLHTGASSLKAYFGRVFVIKYPFSEYLAFGLLYSGASTESLAPSYSNYRYKLNANYLIVLKYVIDGENSYASFIVNPSFTESEPTKGWISDKQGTTTKPDNIGSVALRQGAKGYAPKLVVDGIRVSKSWNDLFIISGLSSPKNSFKIFREGNYLIVEKAIDTDAVEIYNSVGCKIYSSKFRNEAIDIGNLAKGIYIVCVGKNIQKIVI